jgi:hypothetical protein
MSSALKHVEIKDPEKTSGQILRHEILEGRHVRERPSLGLFISGVPAGLDIGFQPVLHGDHVDAGGGADLPDDISHTYSANVFTRPLDPPTCTTSPSERRRSRPRCLPDKT